MSRVWMNMSLAFTLAGSIAFAQSTQMIPAQAPIQAPQGAQRPGGPPVGRQPNSAGAKTLPAPSGVQPLQQGTLDGYIFWDTSAVQHTPSGACDGLIVQVSAGSPTTGSAPTFEQFTPLGNFNKFTYLNNGSNLGVCAYAVKVPVGQDLRVQVMVASSVFSQGVAVVTPPTANNPNAPIKITGGKCNNLPPSVPSPSVLGSNWWTCGNFAYNVNFVLQPSGSGSPNFAGGKQGLLASPTQGNLSSAPTGMLTNSSVPAVQSPGSAEGQGNRLAVSAVQSPGATVQGQGNNGRPSQSTQKALTNTDILKMLKGGVPESVIVSSIQSGTKHFNFGPDGCRALKQGRVSANVLSAMGDGGVQPCTSQATGGAGGKAADDLNPRPNPPIEGNSQPTVAQLTAQLATVSGKIKFVTGQEVKNPGALNSRMIEVLRQQKQGAIAHGQTLSASGSPSAGAPPGGTTQTKAIAASPMLGAPTSVAASPATATSQGPAAGLSSAGTDRFLARPEYSVCQSGKAAISAVNGKPATNVPFVAGWVPGQGLVAIGVNSSVVFTPDSQYNHYTILGCGFGATPGKIYLVGEFPAHGGEVQLFPYHAFGTTETPGWSTRWTDQQIEAEVDPNVSGELDQDAHLVIETSTGTQIMAVGYTFYAQRGAPFMVSQMPTSAFCETTSSTVVKCPSPGYTAGGAILSPCGQWGLTNCTAEILRTAPFVIPTEPRIDQYTINLKTGFTLYSAAVQVAVVATDPKLISQITKTYQPIISGNTIFVREPIVGNGQDYTYSLYGLRILVVGPLGVTDAWANQ